MIHMTNTKQGLSSTQGDTDQDEILHRMGFQGSFDMEFSREKSAIHRTKPKMGYERSQQLAERSRK